jgi:hypothetical protein
MSSIALSTSQPPRQAYRMTAAMPKISNEDSYQAASDLFDVDPERCITQAKKNLQALNISSYYIIENSLLIACAEDDWKEAQYWRLFAEEMYQKSLFQVCQSSDSIRGALGRG